ncbi:MAG: hypothetical protein QOF30_1583 [Acidimicrobiaceae bacterium]|nr:hypothetical protein [Acidimicrobiaceae bacterium]
MIVALALLGGCGSSGGIGSGSGSAARSTSTSTSTTTATSTSAARSTSTSATTTVTTTIPGVPVDMLNPAVTPATIETTICVSGYTTTIRPPVSFTEPLKVHQIVTYGYADHLVRDYEEDHVIALEIGGAAASAVNLFPEPHTFSVPDDTLENSLHTQVCTGRLALADAQRQMLAAKVAHGYSRAASAA